MAKVAIMTLCSDISSSYDVTGPKLCWLWRHKLKNENPSLDLHIGRCCCTLWALATVRSSCHLFRQCRNLWNEYSERWARFRRPFSKSWHRFWACRRCRRSSPTSSSTGSTRSTGGAGCRRWTGSATRACSTFGSCFDRSKRNVQNQPKPASKNPT